MHREGLGGLHPLDSSVSEGLDLRVKMLSAHGRHRCAARTSVPGRAAPGRDAALPGGLDRRPPGGGCQPTVVPLPMALLIPIVRSSTITRRPENRIMTVASADSSGSKSYRR